MDRLDLYRIFARVVEARSFSRAADRLQMPRSSVSAAIAELEARIGARLVHRTTRRVAPTAEGDEFYDRCLAVLADSEELETMFRQAARRIGGRIRVDVPGRIGRLVLAPALPGFLDRYPGIFVEIGMTDRPVDLIGEGVDCALRVGELVESGLRARRICDIAQINVASPAYLARYGTPSVPADLAAHLQVAYASPRSGRIMEWEWHEGGRDHGLRVPWQVSANSAEGYIACALAGLGLIQIPAYDVAGHLRAGELVEVLPEARPAPMPVHLLFPGPSRMTRRLAVFADWLADLVAGALAPPAGG
ncbi:LysR family transcriptional regulator [Pseudogemmobacter sonorensis]|uniref:LysR family transcriptional regulator n=1 Tax=Pseudogemmobacter sonorensis TaxID=2989681 RepID=UPI0036775211